MGKIERIFPAQISKTWYDTRKLCVCDIRKLWIFLVCSGAGKERILPDWTSRGNRKWSSTWFVQIQLSDVRGPLVLVLRDQAGDGGQFWLRASNQHPGAH